MVTPALTTHKWPNIFGHILIVNGRCYGRCCVKKIMPHSSRRKFGNIFSKCLWQVLKDLNSCISNKLNFSWTSPYLRVPYPLKVAEHSFRARFCWCNSASVQGCKRIKKTNMSRIEWSFINIFGNWLQGLPQVTRDFPRRYLPEISRNVAQMVHAPNKSKESCSKVTKKQKNFFFASLFFYLVWCKNLKSVQQK